MADIISRKNKNKKAIPKVDLTPMVDLGFLLITFFIVTTSMTKPVTTKIIFPKNGPNTNYAESAVMNFILLDNNKIVFYNGNDSFNIYKCNYNGNNTIRDQILLKKHTVNLKFGKEEPTAILIKPTTKATYKNIVDLIDEVKICVIKHYVVETANKYEESLLYNLQF